MRKKIDLLGQRFGKLTITFAAPSICVGKSKHMETRWNAICDCGKEINVATGHLRKGSIRSCGCIKYDIFKDKIKNIIGKIFNYLTAKEIIVINNNTHVKCDCKCGKEIVVLYNSLINDNTKSCGCKKVEESSKSAKKMIKIITKQHPRITSARHYWGRVYNDGYGTFEKFLELSQLSCYYCGIKPYRKYSVSKWNQDCDYSKYFKENDLFIYNGLDRINNLLPHFDDNVVPACGVCNKLKSDQTLVNFYNWIKRVTIKDPNIYINLYLELFKKLKPNYSFDLLRIHNSGYKETDYNYFCFLSKQNCFYCNAPPSNTVNVGKDKIKYSGLDRIDSSEDHRNL